MIIDFKNRTFAIGPLVKVDRVTICRLWLWDYIRAGRKRVIVWHDAELWKVTE